MTKGFAAVDQRARILVNTVSDTPRAAMVNWLVVHARLSVHQADTDQKIADTFAVAATQRGLATIEEVTISIADSRWAFDTP